MDPINHSTVPVFRYCNKPYIEILEQPALRSLRFRYKSEIGEGRSAGSIIGMHSTSEARTYPTIKVMNYHGSYHVAVSCVTKDGPPYRPHPHCLVGREECKGGVCRLVVNNADMTCSFTNLGIMCVKKGAKARESLAVREAYRLDPFGTGFGDSDGIDLKVLRLCFQVFIPDRSNSCFFPLEPVVSDPIYDKRAISDLTIMRMSHFSASVAGGTEVILLCDRVAKEDIEVWFYEKQESGIVWESPAEFQPSDVHKQVAISFRIPRYHNENVQQPVNVFVQLRKPSDRTHGKPRPFRYLPLERDPEGVRTKEQKFQEWVNNRFFQDISEDKSLAQAHRIHIGVPRTSRHPVQHMREAHSYAVLGAQGVDSYSQSSTSYAEHFSSVLASAPSFGGPSTSHFTPSDFPTLDASPSAPNEASGTSPLTTAPFPIMQHPEDTGGNDFGETNDTDLDDLIAKFTNSMDLELEMDLTQNLSASMFDSAPNITDTTYQDDPVSNC